MKLPGRIHYRTLALLCVFGLPLLHVSSCSSGKPPQPNQSELIEIGMTVTDSLMKNLGSQLKASLANGKPAASLQFCAQIATPLTKKTSGEHENATVGRTALRVRNSLNKPDETDIEILKKWEAVLNEGSLLPKNELVSAEDGSMRFYRPIRVQKICLTCHGDPATFSTELKAALKEYYPEDQATGYKEGDLRGAFRVEFRYQ